MNELARFITFLNGLGEAEVKKRLQDYTGLGAEEVAEMLASATLKDGKATVGWKCAVAWGLHVRKRCEEFPGYAEWLQDSTAENAENAEEE